MDPIPRLIDNVERALRGKRDAITLAVVSLLAEGHLLLEDVPGTGKTTLARALARSLDLRFRRIQFTADMLPSDVVGVSVLDPESGRFRFQEGPVFGEVILADELNRTAPRTQSSLLECMNERQVTVDGVTRELPRPFLVIATQNPLEYEGTYPLPESQLDRFLIRTGIGYPDREVEREVLAADVAGASVDDLEPVVTAAELVALVDEARRVRVEPPVVDYLLDIVRETRERVDLVIGCSTRGAIGLHRAAQALALVEGRDYCVPDDVKRLCVPVIAHRVVPRSVDDRSTASLQLMHELLAEVPVP